MTRPLAVLFLGAVLLLSACSDGDDGPTAPETPRETTHRVDADGDGDYATIPEAFAAAADGDTILLADGEYDGAIHAPLDFVEKNLVLRSESGDPAACVLTGPAPQGERALVITRDQDAGTVVQGITFRSFYYRDTYFSEGAVALIAAAAPVFRNCVFEENLSDSGGAVACRGSAAVFEACVFRGNRAALDRGEIGSRGGGAVLSVDADNVFRDCSFTANTCTGGDINGGVGGGALRLLSDRSVFWSCDFQDNASFNDGGAVRGSDGSHAFTACVFRRNATEGTAGAASLGGQALTLAHCDFDSNTANDVGAVVAFSEQRTIIERCRFRGNRADNLSGALSGSGPIQVLDSEFLRNAGDDGGAVHLSNGTDQAIADCLFVGNTAAGIGGAVAAQYDADVRIERCTFSGNGAEWRGGALAVSGSAMVLASSTIDGGGSPDGAAVHVASNFSTDLRIEQSIIAETEGGEAVACDDGFVDVSCSDLWNNTGGDFSGGIAAFQDQAGNISADPLFCAPQLLDYSLQAESPCLEPGGVCGGMGARPFPCGEQSSSGL